MLDGCWRTEEISTSYFSGWLGVEFVREKAHTPESLGAMYRTETRALKEQTMAIWEKYTSYGISSERFEGLVS